MSTCWKGTIWCTWPWHANEITVRVFKAGRTKERTHGNDTVCTYKIMLILWSHERELLIDISSLLHTKQTGMHHGGSDHHLNGGWCLKEKYTSSQKQAKTSLTRLLKLYSLPTPCSLSLSLWNTCAIFAVSLKFRNPRGIQYTKKWQSNKFNPYGLQWVTFLNKN